MHQKADPPTPTPAREPHKSATDVLVEDPDAAMAKFQAFGHAVLSVPKSVVDAMVAKKKPSKSKKK